MVRFFRRNNNPLADAFSRGIGNSGTSFEEGQKSNMRPLINMALDQYLVPWFLSELQKLDEANFHRRMSSVYVNRFGQQAKGKDFLGDLRRTRPGIMKFFWLARRNKGMFTINVNYQVSVISNTIRQKGWTLLPHELECFNDTLIRLNGMLNG